MDRLKELKVVVVSGDIDQFPAEALIATINSKGEGDNCIDKFINLPENYMDYLTEVILSGTRHRAFLLEHDNGRSVTFKNIVFVVDAGPGSLGNIGDIIYTGLVGALAGQYTSVTIPVIRTGYSRPITREDRQEIVDEVVEAIREFLANYKETSIETITCVAQNKTVERLLHLGFQVH